MLRSFRLSPSSLSTCGFNSSIESDSRSLKRGFEGWSPSSSIPIQPPTFPGTSQPYGFVNQEEPQHFEELIVPRNQPQQSQNFLSNEELANLLHQTDLSQAGNLGLRESNQEDLLRLLLSSDLTHDIAGPGYNQEETPFNIGLKDLGVKLGGTRSTKDNNCFKPCNVN